MVTAEAYIAELEAKNLTAVERLATAYMDVVSKEGFTLAEILRHDLRLAVEGAEIAALWIADADPLSVKMALAAQCGDEARLYERVRERLTALGTDVNAFDPREGGYSKLFGYMRSLQTTEERACAGQLTRKAFTAVRARLLATVAAEQGDAETSHLYSDVIGADARRHQDTGRRTLIQAATNEESQARARRSSFRVVELLAEAQEPLALKRLLRRK